MKTISKILLSMMTLSLALGIAGLLTRKHLQAATTAPVAANPFPVTVTNTPLPVQNAISPPDNPFFATLCSRTVDAVDCGAPASVTVPSTASDGKPIKHLVIEEISGDCSYPSAAGFSVLTYSGTTVHSIHFYFTGANPNFLGSLNTQVTRVYAAPGEGVALSFTYGFGPQTCTAWLNGYYLVQ